LFWPLYGLERKSWKEGEDMGKKLSTLFGICFLLLFSFTAQVQAAEQGSIQIYAHVEKGESESVPLSGVTFQLYQIADFQDSELILRDEFASIKELPDLSKADANKELAQRYDRFVRNHQINGIVSVTDENGKVTFEQLSRGIYLICQKEDISVQGNTYRSEPAFLAIPSGSTNDEYWNLKIEPKFENEKLPIINEDIQKTDGNIKTGDDSRVEAWLIVLLLSAGVSALCLKRKQNI